MSNDCNMLHETVIKDIVDVVTDIRDAENIKGFLKGRQTSFKSIAAAAENMTLVFPVICTRNLEISNACMVAKAIERKCVSMLQILFSTIAYTDSKNVADYISQYHSNIKLSNNFDIDELLDITDKIIGAEDESYSLTLADEKYINEALEKDRDIYKNRYLPENISENSINDYKIIMDYYGNDIITEALKDVEKAVSQIQKDLKSQANTNAQRYNNLSGQAKAISNTLGGMSNNSGFRLSIGNIGGRGGKGGGDHTSTMKNYADAYSKQILDTDVKKANELVPTSMIVNMVCLADGEPITTSAIVGVKAKLYAADSIDILSHIVSKHVDNNWLHKLIRATTREISFWKDFVFAIDKCKFDAISSAGTSSSAKMWRVLERRSKKSKVRRAMGSKNDGSAITTLVISQEEVEYLKKTENLNIENPGIIKKIMESYNLMCFVIVDEVNECAKFLFDSGDNNFETLSFSSLERESSDNTYKKVINLMSKMR